MSSFEMAEQDNICDVEDKILIYGCCISEMSKNIIDIYESLPDIIQDRKEFSTSLVEGLYRKYSDKDRIEDYIKFTLEVVNLTKDNFQKIKDQLLNECGDVKIARIQCNFIEKSAVITFSNDTKILFRNSPLENIKIFNDIIKWSNSKVSSEHYLNVRRLVSCDNYCFTDYIQPVEYKEVQDPAKYFVYSGQLLALLYILNCRGFKNINMVPQPQYPVLNDLDDIFVCMEKNLSLNTSSMNIVQDIIDSSVYKIDFLSEEFELLAKSYISSIKCGFVYYYKLILKYKSEFTELLKSLFSSNSSYLAIITTRVYGLTENDLKRQLYLLDARFAIENMNKTPIAFADDNSFNRIEKNPLLSLGISLGDHLIQKSIIGLNGSTISRNWITTVRTGKDIIPSPGCYDLYDGNSGIALFLLYLGIITEKEYFINAAIEAMRESLVAIGNLNKKSSIEIGAYKGIAGELYTLSKIYSITKDKNIKEAVKKGLLFIESIIVNQVDTSFFEGTSGIMAVLISIYQNEDFNDIKDGVLNITNMAYKSISLGINNKKAIPGFAYGNDGVMAVLARFMSITGDTTVETAIRELLKLERESDACEKILDKPGWQMGWPGILLSRIIIKECGYKDDSIDMEIYKALDHTIKSGFGNSPYYCDGDMGNLEILEYAADVLKDVELKNRCVNTFNKLLAEVIEPDIINEKKFGNKPLSLMHGISGCGYMLLRRCNNIVPQILWLQ